MKILKIGYHLTKLEAEVEWHGVFLISWFFIFLEFESKFGGLKFWAIRAYVVYTVIHDE